MGAPDAVIHERFTWSDFLSWPEGERWEIIGGEAFSMTPPPVRHQRVHLDLLTALAAHFRKGPCEVLGRPTAVKLSDLDAVEPDILVVCDPAQIRATHIAAT